MDLRRPCLLLLFLACLSLAPRAAHATASLDNCDHLIDALPATISAPGTYCLDHSLTISGAAVFQAVAVESDDVTIDCKGHAISYVATGPSEEMNAIQANQRDRTTVRNCRISGFRFGIVLETYDRPIGRHLIEDNVVEHSSYVGIQLAGDRSVVRRNRVGHVGGLVTSSYYFGIVTDGSIDILDNLVHDVDGRRDDGIAGVAYGISVHRNVDGTVRGNRIRDLAGNYGDHAYFIRTLASGRLLVTGNDIAGALTGKGVAVDCEKMDNAETILVRARDNTIAGVPTALEFCVDAGGNDHTP
jgi:hypothetical protein